MNRRFKRKTWKYKKVRQQYKREIDKKIQVKKNIKNVLGGGQNIKAVASKNIHYRIISNLRHY